MMRSPGHAIPRNAKRPGLPGFNRSLGDASLFPRTSINNGVGVLRYREVRTRSAGGSRPRSPQATAYLWHAQGVRTAYFMSWVGNFLLPGTCT
jgi:hypothetical protein